MSLPTSPNKSSPQALGILVPEFPTQTHIFFWREIVALRQMGVRVCILSTRRPDPARCRHEFAASAAAETHYVYPPSPRASFILAARPIKTTRAMGYLAGLKQSKITRRLKYGGLLLCAADLFAHCREQGIAHIHGHSCADAAHLLAMCRILGGPTYSLTLHGDLPVYGTDHASKMRLASCLTTDGPHLVKQIVEQVGIPPQRVLSNWMGLDTRAFASNDQRAGPPGKLHLATVARLDVCKGHRHALAAVRIAVDQGCDVRYTIAGEGAERGPIENQVRELQLTDRVTLLGTCSEGRVLELLQHADAFVLPSIGLGEAGPISLMEAMSCGLPAICSIIGATPDMITDGLEGLLFKQGDEAGLAAAMVRLASDVEFRRRLGQSARDRAVRQFDVRQTTGRLLDLIHRTSGHDFLPAGK